MSSNENIWLIKSGTHILGPYDYETVVSQLLDRTLSTRDEISQHLKYWLPIIDEPAFAKTVEELRLLALAEEDDELTNTKTVANFTITEDLNARVEAESEEVRRFSRIEKPETVENSPVNNSVKEKNINTDLRRDTDHVQPISYKENNPPNSGKLLWVGILAVIGVLGFVVYKDTLKLSGKSERAVDYFEQGISNLKLSKYIEATESFKENLKLNPSNQETYYYLAQAYISAGQQSEARGVINNENYTEITEDVKLNLLGLSFLKENEVIVSEKYFTKSLNNNPSYIPALVNSSIANHKIGKSNISLIRLKKSLAKASQFPEVSFLYLMRLLDEYKIDSNKTKLMKAQKFIINQFSDSFVMYQESQLISSYISLIANNSIRDPQSELIKIIDNDPAEFDQMNFSPLIDNRAIGWDELLGVCNKVAAAFDDLGATALLSYCRYKNKKYQLAKDVLAINLSKEPTNPLYLALNSLYASELGESKLATASLQSSVSENDKLPSPLALPYILKLTGCLKSSDQKCMEVYSKKVLSVKPNSLLSQVALADLQFKKQNYNESHRIASKASVQAENYLPIQNILMRLGPYVK